MTKISIDMLDALMDILAKHCVGIDNDIFQDLVDDLIDLLSQEDANGN